MSNTIIELRQKDAINVDSNGSYECQLSKDVVIEAGDTVLINKVFIDTVTEGDINIPNDLTLTINSGLYFTNWNVVVANGNTWKNADGTTPTSYVTPDFKRFIPYSQVNSGQLTGCSKYTGFQYQLAYSGHWAGFNITYSYLDWQGNLQHLITSVPENGGLYKNKPYVDVFPSTIIAQTGSVKYVSSTSPNVSNGWTQVGAVSAGAVDVDVMTPFTFQTTIILPAGVYSPLQLTSYLTQKLSETNLSPDKFNANSSDSNFLFTIDDFNQGKVSPDGRKQPNGTPYPLPSQTVFISDDGQIATTFPLAANPSLIGTSQIALEVDQNNRVNFQYMHMPMYDATTGTNISVRYLTKGYPTAGGTVYGVSENSGIYFQSLIATDSNGRYVDFWGSQLGFDLNSLCVGTKTVMNKFGTIDTIINLSNPLVSGVNTTVGYYGLDSTIVKGGTWNERNPIPSTSAGLCSTINSTVPINASVTVTELLNKFSHYIIQTDLGFFNNNYIGQKWYRNINGIASKYYSYGSFAFAESDASIQYTHEGSPIYLKSVKVRLLKSDKTIDTNLGNDNTLILQVIKSGQTMVPVAQPKKA